MMSWKGKAGTKVPAGIEPLTSESNDTGIHNSVQPSQAISTPYDRIQDLKKRLSAAGVKVTIGDLLAMTRKNDPFIAGQPYQVKQAQWFADLWKRFGLGRRIHTRRIHYRAVSQKDNLLTRDDGSPYFNTDSCRAYIVSAAKVARYLGFVDPRDFIDRRNPDPILYRDTWLSNEPAVEVDVEIPQWLLPAIGNPLLFQGLSIPNPQVTGYDYSMADQPYHLELWIEKSTMNDVLVPTCKRLGMNLVTSIGFQSITSVMAMIDRIVDLGKPARIFYVTDFDPAGSFMALTVARQVEFWLQDHPDVQIKLEPVALSEQQCIDYQLPRTPIKDADIRKANFENRYGTGATELDALEALYPGELGD